MVSTLTLTRGDRTLGNHGWTILECGTPLEDAVEVNSSALVPEGIINIQLDCISNLHVESRTRPLSIDADERPRETVRGRSHPRDVPIVSSQFSGRYGWGGGGGAGRSGC